jgi:hypothetical protein
MENLLSYTIKVTTMQNISPSTLMLQILNGINNLQFILMPSILCSRTLTKMLK